MTRPETRSTGYFLRRGLRFLGAIAARSLGGMESMRRANSSRDIGTGSGLDLAIGENRGIRRFVGNDYRITGHAGKLSIWKPAHTNDHFASAGHPDRKAEKPSYDLKSWFFELNGHDSKQLLWQKVLPEWANHFMPHLERSIFFSGIASPQGKRGPLLRSGHPLWRGANVGRNSYMHLFNNIDQRYIAAARSLNNLFASSDSEKVRHCYAEGRVSYCSGSSSSTRTSRVVSSDPLRMADGVIRRDFHSCLLALQPTGFGTASLNHGAPLRSHALRSSAEGVRASSYPNSIPQHGQIA